MIDNSYQKQVITALEQSAGATISLIIKDLIKEHVSERTHLETLWDEYKGQVPILSKPKLGNKNAPDNRPVSGFRNIIVGEKVGYMTGVPIKVVYPEGTAENDLIQNFLKINNYESIDSNTMTYLAATGNAYRLLYLSQNSVTEKMEVHMSNQMPWECVVVADSTLLDMPVYGLIYYKIEIVAADGKRVWRYKAEFYDDEKVYYYIENDSGNYIPYTKDGPSEEIHGFSLMPLIKFNNNLLNQGDFETVRALCDGYDNALSYALNDNESFSNALMVFKDVPLTQTLIDQARYLRGIQIDSTPTKPDPSVTYLTKDIQIDNTETLTDILSEDIFKFSSTIDIYDEAFSGGNVSGESRKQQLIPLELKCKETERLFQHSLMQMFTVISTYWAKLSKIIVKPEEIDFIFIRSIIPTEQTIEQLIQLKKEGIISIETVLSKLSFIDDPQDELERLGKLLPTNTGE